MEFLGFVFSIIILISAIAPAYGKTSRFRFWYQVIELFLFALGIVGLMLTLYFESNAARQITELGSFDWVQDSFSSSAKIFVGTALGVSLLTILSLLVTPHTMILIKKILPAATSIILLIVAAVFMKLSENDTLPALTVYIFASGLCSSLLMHLPYFFISFFQIHPAEKTKKKQKH